MIKLGILDKVGKLGKDLGTGIIKTGKAIKTEIDTNIEIQRKKRSLLNKFTMNDLKKICNEYGIGEPSSYEEEPFSDKRTKIKLTRDDYIDYIVKRLDLKNIEDFCDKSRARIHNITEPRREPVRSQPSYSYQPPEPVKELPREEPKIQVQHEVSKEPPAQQYPSGQSELHEILHEIKEQFRPEPCINEKELQGQLKIWLDVMYRNRATREVPTMAGRVDIGIDKNKYGIEVKIANDKGTLRNLVGQVLAYKKYFNEIGIILLDVNELHPSMIHEYITEYKNQGVETIIIQGQLRKRKGRPREVRVKY